MTKTPEELTEEWKAGKLNDGEKYFIRYKNSIFIATFRYFKARINYWRFIDNGIEYCDDSEEDLIEVLAPYTYDEYKAMQEKIADSNKKVENLGYLLKECKANLINRHIIIEELGKLENPTRDLLTRINAALGESEEK